MNLQTSQELENCDQIYLSLHHIGSGISCCSFFSFFFKALFVLKGSKWFCPF